MTNDEKSVRKEKKGMKMGIFRLFRPNVMKMEKKEILKSVDKLLVMVRALMQQRNLIIDTVTDFMLSYGMC